MPLSLSDSELQIAMTAAAPIPPHHRDQFLRDVVGELEKHPEIGAGIIGRVCAKVQKQHLNPPALRGHNAKYD